MTVAPLGKRVRLPDPIRMKRPIRVISWGVLTVAAACAAPVSREAAGVGHDVVLPLDTATIEGRVPRAATLEALLRQNQVQPDIAASLAMAVSGVFNPRSLQADRTFRLTRTIDGLFREFQYQIDTNRFLRVVLRPRGADGQAQFDVAVVPYPREVAVEAVTADITRERPSLIAAFEAAGEKSPQLPLALADMFGGEIDFNTELQQGDSASVLFERVRREGQVVGYGDVQAAVLEHGRRQIVGIRFVGSDGKPAWYDENGRSLKRQFLKSPLPFEPRVTSGFTNHRLHPLFGDYRAHLGVDYAAQTGTSVVSVAAGTVESADWSGDAGRLVVIRHAGGYETLYLHLSSFGPGIHPGAHVNQGQLIGRVGMTGAATGPHLDFRVKKNGLHVNPVIEHSRMPPGEPIAESALSAFAEVRDHALEELRGLTTKDPKDTKSAKNSQ
jgi:murein DD-endopeptidase MepM/ murein hydrolase activator NlpD